MRRGPRVRALRRQQVKKFLLSAFLSNGTPMFERDDSDTQLAIKIPTTRTTKLDGWIGLNSVNKDIFQFSEDDAFEEITLSAEQVLAEDVS